MRGAKNIPNRMIAIFLLAGSVGLAGGLLGAGFQLGLNWLQNSVIGPGASSSLSEAVQTNLSPWATVLIPTVGGLLAGMILMLVRNKNEPFGIADIVGLVALRRGTIRLRASLLQILSSTFTIGSGGSIGKEGANSQIAATIAAQFARLFRIGSRDRAVLLGCGVAAGVATSYNAPIAGAIFVMEGVLGNFAMDVFAPVVVASVVATMVRHEILGYRPVYDLPESLPDLSPQLILTALLLGVFCGLGGIMFRLALRQGRRFFLSTRLPRPLTMAIGGLVVGIIGLWAPKAWGNGFEVIENISSTELVLAPVLLLFLAKVIATVATVGSGGLGGIFTPNLVVGAAFGAFFVLAIQHLAPPEMALSRNESIIFTFVGMAGLCAAVTHAPVTSIVLVFELTGRYELVLPIMLCSITASIVSRMLNSDSYYSEALREQGKTVPQGLEELALRTTYVRDIMRKDVVTVDQAAGFDLVMEQLAKRTSDTLYVVSATGGLVGRIQLQDVKNFINDPTLSSVVIAADLTRPAVTSHPEDSLATVLPRFDDPEVTELAVTAPDDRQLLGRIRQKDVLGGISSEVLGHQQRRARLGDAAGPHANLIELPDGWEIASLQVPGEWAGLSIDNLADDIRHWLVPVLIVHQGPQGEERLPAAQEHVLQHGQELLALCRSADLERWRQQSTPPPQG